MDGLLDVFCPLILFPQFILYRLEGDGIKKIKRPINFKTGIIANALDPVNQTDLNTAVKALKNFNENHGLGFVLTENDPFFFLDIDGCISDRWSDLAVELCGMFNGAFFEISSSQKGLHIIGSGNPSAHSCKNEKLNIEFYTQNRFIALTGINPTGDFFKDFTPILPQFIDKYFPVKTTVENPHWWSDAPVAEWRGPTEDHELIRRMLQSQGAKSVFNEGVRFADLWEANEKPLVLMYPAHDTDIYNRSSADAALAQHLAFWTGNHAARMLRLMQLSKLHREKWGRDDYLPMTIRSACSMQNNFLQDKPVENKLQYELIPTQFMGATFLNAENQAILFNGCVYICDENSILIPGGAALDRERFNVMYGGRTMQLDNANSKTTKHAWDAFTQSQLIRFPKVHSACFKPNLKYGEIIDTHGQLSVNNYWPYETQITPGDPTPFLNHIEKLTPDALDQAIFLAYLAALLQYPGVKFEWCIVLQGVQGNGKTFISDAINFAVGRMYCQSPRSDQLCSRFNDWLYRTIFITIEEFQQRGNDTMEILKPMIDSPTAMIEPKNGKKIMRDVCGNFIINTNHKDGLKKTEDDRRFAVFYTPQQSILDLKKYGMDSRYFSKLYDWAIKRNGFAIIHHYLLNYQIPDELNPAFSSRAPATTSTQEAIRQGQGYIEQQILECVDEDKIGFRRGWISSKALDALLESLKLSHVITPNRRRALMQKIGYDWHPALIDGRSTTIIPLDGGKPRLYVTYDHPSRRIKDAQETVKSYIDAQNSC